MPSHPTHPTTMMRWNQNTASNVNNTTRYDNTITQQHAQHAPQTDRDDVMMTHEYAHVHTTRPIQVPTLPAVRRSHTPTLAPRTPTSISTPTASNALHTTTPHLRPQRHNTPTIATLPTVPEALTHIPVPITQHTHQHITSTPIPRDTARPSDANSHTTILHMLQALGHELQSVKSQQQQCQQQLQEIARDNQHTAEPVNVIPATATSVTDTATATASGINRRPHSNAHAAPVNQSTLPFLRTTTHPQHASAAAGQGTSTQTRVAQPQIQ